MAVRNDNRSFIAGGIGIALILLTGVLRWMTPARPFQMPPVVDFPGHTGQDPKIAEFFIYRAEIRRKAGDLQGALEDNTRAIAMDPTLTVPYHHRGILKVLQKDFMGALDDYDEAIRLDPGFAGAYRSRGFLKNGHGDFEGAIADFTKALEFDQDTPKLFYDRGCARYNLQAWQEALSDFEAAAARAPSLRDEAQLRIFLARSRAGRQKEGNEGIRAYLKQRVPDDGTSWTLESLRFSAGETPEKDYLERIPSVDGKPQAEQACEAYFLAGSLRLIQGDRAGAKESFSRSVATGADSFNGVDCSRAELKALDDAPPK